MKYFIIVPTLVAFLALGCLKSKSQSASQSTPADTLGVIETAAFADTVIPFDTIQKKEIEKLVDEINVGVRAQGMPTSVAFPHYYPADTLDYWTVNREPARISLPSASPSQQTVIWPTFFVYKGELILVRYRTWRGEEAFPWAMESMVYLNDGQIVYCEERRVDLQKGEAPAVLRQKPFEKSKRSPTEIKADYQDYWENIHEFIRPK